MTIKSKTPGRFPHDSRRTTSSPAHAQPKSGPEPLPESVAAYKKMKDEAGGGIKVERLPDDPENSPLAADAECSSDSNS